MYARGPGVHFPVKFLDVKLLITDLVRLRMLNFRGRTPLIEIFIESVMSKKLQLQSKRDGTPRPKRMGKRTPQRNVGLPMYRSVRPIMPEEYETDLTYLVLDVLASVGAFGASLRFQSNAYDVDPALASTAMAGFAELATIYQRFRTIGMAYQFSCFNQELFGMTLIHGFSNTSIASGGLGIGYAGNPLFRSTAIGGVNGMSLKTCSGSATVVQIVGTAQPLYDDLFTGSTTSSTLPTSGTVYCYLGWLSNANAGTALGVNVTVRVTLRVRFYKPVFLAV